MTFLASPAGCSTSRRTQQRLREVRTGMPDRSGGPGPAGRGECYLCGRCTEACPMDGALVYARAKCEK